MKSLGSTVAELIGAQHFYDAPVSQPRVNFGPKSCFDSLLREPEVVYQIWSRLFQGCLCSDKNARNK